MLATVKHTFLHWYAADESPPRRARSADVQRTTATDMSEYEDCVQKLNKISAAPESKELLAPPAESPVAPSVEELRTLQRKIAECAGFPAKDPVTGLSSKRILSSSSVSTMASEAEDHSISKVNPMHKACSSGSVSSMCSELWADCQDDTGLTTIEIGPIIEEDERDHPRVAAAKDGSKAEFTHNQVPKTVNLAAEFSKTPLRTPPTTMMIRNIPNRYTQREFVRELDGLGFEGTYDFLYLPIDKGTLCNVGYAFVNFLEPVYAQRSMEVFHNYVFQRYRKVRGKIAAVSIAHIQGLEANMRHYENSAVNMAPRIKQQRGPLIIPRGSTGSEICP
ncbi:ML3 [Symbiodinium natans]|uniref:ML3 protein n=1 Tax=Symbiodinium natans TaxID=878477 RepID=A0A812L6B1_9DINO|nr:ML3 [Symbiodinium natans]